MKFNRSLVPVLILAAMVGAGSRAQAASIPSEALTYDVTLQSGVNGVSQILLLDQQSSGSVGWSWTYSLSSGSSSLTQNWPLTTGFLPVTATAALGLTTNIPGDPVGGTTTHLVVLGNFTAGEIGESFSTLFPDANESSLIYDLTNIYVEPNPNVPLTQSTFYADVAPFVNDALSLGLFIPSGGNLDVVAFTNGQLIGTGTFEAVTNTPEPSSAILLGFGLLGLGFHGFRMRKRTAPKEPACMDSGAIRA